MPSRNPLLGRALRSPLFLLVVLFAAAGCGGGGDAEPAVTAAVAREDALVAKVAGCSDAAVHDSGQVVYVVVPASCPGDASRQVTLGSAEHAGSGAARSLQLAVDQEMGAVDIPGRGVRRVGLFRSGQWRKFDNTASWAARDGAGLLVHRGELYLLGGWLNGPVTNEVWKSSDAEHWQFLGHAPWQPRHGAAWLVHDGRIWVIGGDLLADVWSSPDGVQWTQETAAAPFGARYTPNAVSLDGEIVVYAGHDWTPVPWCNERPDCAARGDRSVWKSRDGRTWQLAVAQAPWEGRGLVHGSLVHDGEIYLVGGGLKVAPPNARYAETSAEFSDIWSSRDGIRWQRRADNLGFLPRTHFSVASTPAGCFVSDGSVGTQGNISNELYFAADCVRYAAVATPADMSPRHASSVAYFNGSLVILGGPDYGNVGNAGTAVWQYFP